MTGPKPTTTSITVDIAGSTLANPGPGGWAFVCRTAKEGEELCRFGSSGGELRSTAPRLEMLAAIRAFQFLRDLPPETSATIVSSSQFLYKGSTNGSRHGRRRAGASRTGSPLRMATCG